MSSRGRQVSPFFTGWLKRRAGGGGVRQRNHGSLMMGPPVSAGTVAETHPGRNHGDVEPTLPASSTGKRIGRLGHNGSFLASAHAHRFVRFPALPCLPDADPGEFPKDVTSSRCLVSDALHGANAYKLNTINTSIVQHSRSYVRKPAPECKHGTGLQPVSAASMIQTPCGDVLCWR